MGKGLLLRMRRNIGVEYVCERQIQNLRRLRHRLEEVPLPLCIICASSMGMKYNHRLNSGLFPTVVIRLDIGGLERVNVESIGARIT